MKVTKKNFIFHWRNDENFNLVLLNRIKVCHCYDSWYLWLIRILEVQEKKQEEEEKAEGSEEEKPKEKSRSLFDEHARIRLEKQRKEILADQIRKQLEEEQKILDAVREERALLRMVFINITHTSVQFQRLPQFQAIPAKPLYEPVGLAT